MQRWRDLTLGDVFDGLARYRPFVITVAGILLLAIVLPGNRGREASLTDATALQQTGPGVASGPGQIADASSAATDGRYTVTGGVPTGGGPGGGGGAGASGAGVAQTTQTQVTAAQQALGDPLSAPDCDKVTGRLKLPTIYGPNCVGMWAKGADNGGATYQGVTGDTVVVALYIAESNDQAAAIVAAAGASDDTSDEEDDRNRDKVIEAYEHHFETYGRHVEWVKVEGTGPADDEQAAKSDAIKVATEVKAFVSFGAPNNTYVDELAARGVMCFCTVSQPIENYLAWAPHVFSPGLMASTQGYVHRAEYLGRLAGKPAQYAGDAVYKTQDRKFAIVYYETRDNAYKAGVDFFEKELTKYNIKLSDRIAYILDLTKAQEDARVIIARLKDRGINSLLFSGDPLMPIFLTQEATKQVYSPEWVISGSALTDTTFFARTYDQTQWANAFGISYLTARVSEQVAAKEPNLVEWHFGEPLTSYPSSLNLNLLFTGMHLAGPKLTPATFRDGMFSFKPTGGFITQFAVSYGNFRWPWDDYVAADDATEIWWDPAARGTDELGNEGVGMYRYMDMGKRYLPGEWPKGEPVPFVTEGTTTMYTERPEPDRAPVIEHNDGTHVRVTPAQHKGG